ncbi:MAG TPA: hypothetical protein VHE61_01890 [Opitutaceae bacterium]|nr:hypothetical protein [Opitutaceae bacterium]
MLPSQRCMRRIGKTNSTLPRVHMTRRTARPISGGDIRTTETPVTAQGWTLSRSTRGLRSRPKNWVAVDGCISILHASDGAMNTNESDGFLTTPEPSDDRIYPSDFRRIGPDSIVTKLTGHASALPDRFHSLRSLADLTAREAVLPVTALIFHCSRCGSTLLTRLLELDAGRRVFAEPVALPKFLAAYAPALMRGEAEAELRTFIQAFGLKPLPRERGLIVKLTSRSIAYLPAFRAAFPEVPFIYLFREPVEVVASLEVNPPPFLNDRHRQLVAAEFDSAPPDVARLSRVDWLAWYIDRNLRLALRHSAEFTEAIDYSAHANAYPALARKLGSEFSPADTVATTRVLSRHSKQPDLAFRANPTKRLTAEQIETVQSMAGSVYELWRQQNNHRT